MTVLKRRRKGAQADEAGLVRHSDEELLSHGGSEFAVAAFEFVEVEATVLARLTGTWSGDRSAPVDMQLVLTLPQGERHEFTALAETSAGARVHLERAVWQATFMVPRWVLARRGVEFALEAAGGSIALPRPERHDLAPAVVSPAEPESEGGDSSSEVDVDALAGRVRQAEAAISWTQRQLARERDARRDAEEERAAAETAREIAEKELSDARPEIEARKQELERIASMEARLAEIEPLEA